MNKYGATPDQTSKTAQGCPGQKDNSGPVDPRATTHIIKRAESLKERLEREKKK